MSRDGRKPWEIPIQYNDDRWAEPKAAASMAASAAGGGQDDGMESRDARDVEEILSRPDRSDEREYECNDTTPINYGKGPHDEEFGVEDHDFDQADSVPVDYSKGPHEDEFGIEDDEEMEPLGDEPEFPEL